MYDRIELHAHTTFSNVRLVDSTNTVEKLIDTAIEVGVKGIAITDHELLSAIPKAFKYYDDKYKESYPDFKIIAGNEIYLTDIRPAKLHPHFIIHAKDLQGYYQLQELSSIAWLNSYTSRGLERVDTLKSDIERVVSKNPGHLIASTACFTAGAKVETDKGLKAIQDIQKDDLVLTHTGEYLPVNFPTSRNYEGMGYTFNFRKGWESDCFTCTEDHKILTYNKRSKRVDWKEAKNIETKDYCMYPIKNVKYTNKNILQIEEDYVNVLNYRKERMKKNGYNKDCHFIIPNQIAITDSLMRLFGLWLGDGSISSKDAQKQRITLSFSDKEFKNYYESFVYDGLLDLGLTDSDILIKEKVDQHKVEITLNKRELVLFFEALFGRSHAEDKHIPKRLLHISKELDANLWFGYMLADGYFRIRKDGGECVAASISKKLINDMYLLSLSLNLSGGCTVSKAKRDKNGVNHNESYYLNIPSKTLGEKINKENSFSTEELIKILDSVEETKRQQDKNFIDYNGKKYLIRKIKSIKTNPLNEKVYCLNNDNHSFICEGVIVHNCLGGELSKLILALDKAEKVEAEELRVKVHNRIVEFVLWCKKIFKDDFYFEIQPATSNEQIIVNKRMKALSKAFNVKIIVTSDVHYLRPENRSIHKALLNSKDGEREVDAFYYDAFFHTEDEIFEKLLKSDYSKEEVVELFNNSMEIYNKIESYNIFKSQSIPYVEVKDYEKKKAPAACQSYPNLSAMFESNDKINRYWVNECWKGLNEKNLVKKEYLEELEEEADVKKIIGEKLGTNMFGYPVLLQHYFDKIWDLGSVVGAGRGSACSALNHYLLNLTQLDPLQWNMPFFRYLNRERVELGDLDTDMAPTKRPAFIQAVREERRNYLSNDLDDLSKEKLGCVFVGTFGTETTKGAVQRAMRGYRSEEFRNGIDVDVASYISSLVSVERGFVWPLNDMVYGNPDKKRKPNQTFVKEVNNYPGLLEIMQGIENLVVRRGIHASGVILLEGNPYEKIAFMKAPNGEITTQYDLHDCEAMGCVKIDLLVTEVVEKIGECIKLLQKDNVIESNLTLREAYNKYLHPNVLNLNDEDTWENIRNVSTLDCFQFSSDIGKPGVKRLQPKTINELSSVNALIRLMTGEDGGENPIDKYARFKDNPLEIEREMNKYNLTQEEKDLLNKYLKSTFGLGISQEQLMRVLMDENICNFTLGEANSARKVIGKKQMKKIPELKEKIFKQASSAGIGKYVWDNIATLQAGYSFSDIHSISYTMIGYQTAYLATKWNPIYWNTACLLVNSGSLEESSRGTNYGKISKALGDIQSHGVNISLIDVNKSGMGFEPDVENNQILFGLKALDRMSEASAKKIIEGRPYKGIKDFMNRCSLNKQVMIPLIKAGAFDNLDFKWASNFGEVRRGILFYYLMKTSDLKKKITMQNFNSLQKNGFISDEYKKEKDIWNYTNYLRNKKNKRKTKDYYLIHIDELNRINELIDNNLDISFDGEWGQIPIKQWDKIYSNNMESIKAMLIDNQEELLKKVNEIIFKESYEKYGTGSLSKWEMQSLCFYYHEHELVNVNKEYYGIENFFNLPEEPEIEKFLYFNERSIPIFKLTKVIGTVIEKDKIRSSITLLTENGVFSVKLNKEYFSRIDRRLSEILNEDGKKKVLENSWLTRGNKLMITGYRRGDQFVAKKYKRTPGHTVYLINNVLNSGEMILTHQRANEMED